MKSTPKHTETLALLAIGLLMICVVIGAPAESKPTPEPPITAAPPTPAPITTPTPTPITTPTSRYTSIQLSDADIRLLAQMTYAEARGEPHEGKIAVNKVVFNRLLSPKFPKTVYDIIYAEGQFSTAPFLANIEPDLTEYIAVREAYLDKGPMLDLDVVYFSQKGENDKVATKIGNHIFCYTY